MGVKAERFVKLPIADLISPEKSGPLMPYENRWWHVTEDDCVLLFDGLSPQCNTNKLIAERWTYPFKTELRFIPWGYVQFKISDYT